MMPFMQPMRRAGVLDEYTSRFLPWLNAFATATDLNPYPNVAAAARSQYVRCQLSSAPWGGANMWGSPWAGAPSYGLYTYDSNMRRVIQHLFEDQEAADQNVDRKVLFWGGSDYGPSDTVGRLKNGYESQSYSVWDCMYGAELEYYDNRYPGVRRRSSGYSGAVISVALP